MFFGPACGYEIMTYISFHPVYKIIWYVRTMHGV